MTDNTKKVFGLSIPHDRWPFAVRVLIDACQNAVKIGFSAQERVELNIIRLGEANGETRGRMMACIERLRGAYPSNGITIQIGGFKAGSRSFMSRGCHPFERTFFIENDQANGHRVMMLTGWEADFDHSTLGWTQGRHVNEMRRAAAVYNFGGRCQYGETDNELNLRLGYIDQAMKDIVVVAFQKSMRQKLGGSSVRFNVGLHDVFVVEYVETSLQCRAARRTPLADFTPMFLKG